MDYTRETPSQGDEEDSMEKISDTFSSDHVRCDELFFRSEEHVQRHEWWQAKETLTRFIEEMDEHFFNEEDILFPALNKHSANAAGPTRVMRLEHDDMRQLMKDMQDDIKTQDADHFLGSSETLLVMMRQHNTKEENILYPMADDVLAGDQEKILAHIQEHEKKRHLQMEQERVLNVSELEPPGPMEKILEAIETLTPGHYLRILHSREPFPLYTLLDEYGYRHCIREGKQTLFEIFVWRKNDDIAKKAVGIAMEIPES